jgi:DNA-binding transcriptional regulator LsrR (DeoR family)
MTVCTQTTYEAREVGRELGLSEIPISADLEALATRGLLEVRIASDILYRFAPTSLEMARAVRALAAAFRAKPMEVLTLLLRR